MNKYLKTSLILTAVYVALAAILPLFDNAEGSISNFFVNNVGSCWSSGEMSSSCSLAIKFGGGLWQIPYYGMILAALASAITGLIAVYQAIKSHASWWHVITIYGALNALLVFGTAFAMLTT